MFPDHKSPCKRLGLISRTRLNMSLNLFITTFSAKLTQRRITRESNHVHQTLIIELEPRVCPLVRLMRLPYSVVPLENQIFRRMLLYSW